MEFSVAIKPDVSTFDAILKLDIPVSPELFTPIAVMGISNLVVSAFEFFKEGYYDLNHEIEGIKISLLENFEIEIQTNLPYEEASILFEEVIEGVRQVHLFLGMPMRPID